MGDNRMKKRVKKLWIKALDDSEIDGKPVAQAIERLRDANSKVDGQKVKNLCCLGVLCELAVIEGVIPKAVHGPWGDDFEYDGADVELPLAVQEWAGLA